MRGLLTADYADCAEGVRIVFGLDGGFFTMKLLKGGKGRFFLVFCVVGDITNLDLQFWLAGCGK